jgi:cell division protein FtsZ
MGSGRASGENRAHRAVDMALESPLLNDSDIYGAKHVLLNITHGADELTMDEISEITDTIQERAGSANVIWGYGHDGRLGDEICITVIATGWDAKDIDAVLPGMQTQVSQVVVDVNTKAEEMVSISSVEAPVNQAPQEITAPVVSPVMRFELDNEPQAVSPFEAMQHAEVKEKEETPFVQNEVEFEIEFPAEEEGFEVRNVTDISHDTEVSAVEFKIKESVAHNQEENASPFQMLGFESMESSNATEDVHMPFRETAQNQAERNTMGHLQTERVDRIRQLTQKMKTPNGLSSLEDEPAYVRRKISLDVAPDSQSSMASRFGMNEVTDANGEKRYELKNNNPFLHDNAD